MGELIQGLLSCALVLAAAVACAVRSVRIRRERGAWLALGLGLACWGFGGVLAVAGGKDAAFPGPADGVALLVYPAVCASLALFARRAVTAVQPGVVLDAGVEALAMAAVGAAIAFWAGSFPSGESAIQLAYVTGDLVAIAAVVAAFAIAGWRPGRRWLLVGAGLLTGALTDLAHSHSAGAGIQPEGVLALGWPVGALLICWGAFERIGAQDGSRVEYRRILLVPAAFAVLATALVAIDQLRSVGSVSIALAIGALLATTARPGLGFRDNVRVLARSQHEALTDSLTGVGNRRKLMTDLRQQIRAADAGSERILVLFDLDGFKQYNDTYGHPAGDALLGRLGASLRKAVGPYGTVYRMGGDEFCVLLKVGMASARMLTSIAAAALSERGEGFEIKSSYGAVMLPQEARDPARALKIADQRMYAQKEKRRPSAGRQTRDLLLQVLRERDPELSAHMSAVSELSRRVGQRLKLLPEELDETVRAAELHDVGKMAIPDAILHKPGPLDEEEWEFVHKHTVIGERILAVAPALIPVAKVVRSSHERWDGQGYPDKLQGDAIPIGARIVSACDAFHAMTSARPYGATLSVEEALSEMRRAAGAEFDPRVVMALVEVVGDARTLVAPSSPGAAPSA